MSKISIKIEGVDELFADLKRLGAISEDAVVDTLNDIADDTKQLAVDGIKQGPASGRTYTRGSVTRRASEAGEYPMSDTGRLMGSIRSIEASKALPQAVIGTDLIYGAHLEFGTSKMEARPWLERSFIKAAKGVETELKAKLEGKL